MDIPHSAVGAFELDWCCQLVDFVAWMLFDENWEPAYLVAIDDTAVVKSEDFVAFVDSSFVAEFVKNTFEKSC